MWTQGNGWAMEPIVVGEMSRFKTIAFANAPVVA